MFYIVRLRLGLKGLLHHRGRCSTGRMMKNIKTDSLFNPGKQKAVGDSVVRLITFVLPVYVLAFDLVTHCYLPDSSCYTFCLC